jgi:cell division transport system ATP-binding protein
MIQMYDVHKKYTENVEALNGINLKISKGEFVFITGPSGAGKTTFIKIILGWEKIDRGQMIINGINMLKIKRSKLSFLRRNIGVVFQDFKLIKSRSVYDNIAFSQKVIGIPYKEIKRNTWEILKNIGLSNKKDSFPLELAGGEQQRIAIARALINKPKILLADEPTGNIDPEMMWEIMKLFIKANINGTTVVFATHNWDLLKTTKHRIIHHHKGKIVD